MLSFILFLFAINECHYGYHVRPGKGHGHYGHGHHGHGNHGQHGHGRVKNGQVTVLEKTLGWKDDISDYIDGHSDFTSSSSSSSSSGFSIRINGNDLFSDDLFSDVLNF